MKPFDELGAVSNVRLLALETSGAVGSVCLCEDDKLLAERSFGGAKQHGRDLVPCVESLFREVGWDARKGPDVIAVSQGPGSFTGLRVGIAFVKTLAYATGCAVVGVSSLDVLAQNALLPEAASIRGDAKSVGAVIDARRGLVYCAAYVMHDGVIERQGDVQLLSPAEFLKQLPRPALLIGDALAAYRDQFSGEDLRPAPENLWIPRASVVARLGLVAYRANKRDNPLELAPIYLRVPEAEEVRLKKLGKL